MKMKISPLLILLFLLPFPARADGELEKLVHAVLRLRTPGTDAAVKDELSRDEKWTLMSEIGLHNEGECTFEDDYEEFALNHFAVDIAEHRVGKNRSAGLFCNGLDENFKHSFIEKVLRPGADLTYRIPGRKGEQEIVLIPLHPEARLSVTLTAGSRQVPPETDKDGCLRYRFRIGEGEVIDLNISNGSEQPEAVAILNYNSRQ